MKKILTLLLISMIFLSGISANANNEEISADGIRTILGKLEIMNGYPDGYFYPEKSVTRAEFAKIAVMASAYRDYVASGMNTSPFADVPYTHWAAPYVKLASVNKYISGYPDSTFRPENNVLMEEAITVVVKMLGYNDDDFAASWPYGQIGIAKNTGLLNGVSASMGESMSRGDVAQLIYNMLRTKPKSVSQASAEYINSVGYSIIENVTVLATSKEDSSVGAGRVSTTAGTFKIDDDFNYGSVGKRGYALTSNSNEFLAFVGNDFSNTNYTVYSVLENEIVAYKDGNLVSLKLSDNLTAYYKLQTMTVGTLKKDLETGYMLSVAYDFSGKPEYVSVSDGALQGPVTVYSDVFYKTLGLSSNPVVMRDGNKSSLSNITNYDVVYYSTDLDMIWAYSKKITGTYEAAYPSRDAVSSVNISGTTYNIESADAAVALSSSGEFSLGDTITVMIGKDGNIAGVLSPEKVNNNVYGFVTDAGTSEFTDSDGNVTSSRFVQIVHTDGSIVKYKTNSNYSSYINKVVKVELTGGLARLSSIKSSSAISGMVDYENLKIGNSKLSSNVRILEVTSTETSEPANYTTIFASRLDGINIKASKIMYYSKDNAGRVTDLIIHNVTGDAYQYGIVTSAKTAGDGGSYTAYRGTTKISISSGNTKYSVKEGQPVQLVMNGNNISSMITLAQISENIETISSAYVTAGNRIYRVSDDCVVYNSQYTVMNINDTLNDESLKCYAYVDKYSNTVRVIKALKK